MGPGICVPGRSRRLVSPRVMAEGFNGAGHLCARKGRARPRYPGASPCRFNGAGHLCARKASTSRPTGSRCSCFNGAGHLCARKVEHAEGGLAPIPKLQWGRASVCPEGGDLRSATVEAVAQLQWGRASVCPEGLPESAGLTCATAASMGPGICVPGRQQRARGPAPAPPSFNGAGHLCARKAARVYSRRSAKGACFNGAGHLCARKGRGVGQPRNSQLRASMGPGICVPGRWGRRTHAPPGRARRFNGAGHLCARKGAPFPRARARTKAGFNGAGHLCARKVAAMETTFSIALTASMGPGICVPGRMAFSGFDGTQSTPGFNGAGHLCARKAQIELERRLQLTRASMGPGICVPGRSWASSPASR